MRSTPVNTAYVVVAGIDSPNADFGSEPAGIDISYIILNPSLGR